MVQVELQQQRRGDCVEVAYHWQKSSHCDDKQFACVEVAAHPGAIHVRDSKDPEGPALTFSPDAWSAFAAFAAAQDVSVA